MRVKLITSLLAILLMASFAFAGVTEMRIWCDEMMEEDPGNPGTRYGTKSDPGSFYVVRWCIKHSETEYMKITDNDPAAGPYCMEVMMNNIPSNNLWMDMRRQDATVGWQDPLDASATERVTFWIKAAGGTCPVWFYPLDQPAPSGYKNVGTSVRIEGETVITQDEFGEYVLYRHNLFNDNWQFVSIPWTFFMEKDSAIVWDVLPYSFVHEGTEADNDGDAYSFTPATLRTLTWPTITTDDGPHGRWDAVYRTSPDCKWNPDPAQKIGDQIWTFDELIFCLNEGTGITDVDGNPTVMPLTYELGNCYPNPFNPTTEIEYAIPVSNHVSIDVFNAVGQKVKTLVNRYMTAGTYRATWDGMDDNGNTMPSGVYFYKMTSSHFNSVKRMILLK